ncbi:hypothetical protein ILUMI_25371 [Ignelater luminosus]|uniref:Uncharacterized protein n=1 Tax=Ignelater luminosus TaxID=2038154 RepID=A0A8K0G045_IGNLU|nr:hypothetical protein ILUMI_25371 [Ignelater luminosus]
MAKPLTSAAEKASDGDAVILDGGDQFDRNAVYQQYVEKSKLGGGYLKVCEVQEERKRLVSQLRQARARGLIAQLRYNDEVYRTQGLEYEEENMRNSKITSTGEGKTMERTINERSPEGALHLEQI